VTADDLIRRFIDSGQRAQAAVNFEIAKAELRKLGITLWQRPGEYLVNLDGGPDQNALTAETLDDAVQFGLDMAKTFAPATTSTTAAPGKRYRRPRRMTPKAQRRRFFRAHARQMQARAKQRDKE
jgi:hypothetical protein